MEPDISDVFKKNKIVPDVIPTAPEQRLKVQFTGINVIPSEELTPTQVQKMPYVTWKCQQTDLHTLSFFDPDADPSADPSCSQWRHWLVTNIPGDCVISGDTVTSFISSGPAQGSGLHRYVFLVYKQPAAITVDPALRSSRFAILGRDRWSMKQFSEHHGLGDPIAGNMYLAQWDDFVPKLHRSLAADTVKSCNVL